MFEIVATRTACSLYVLVITGGVVALAWLCLANLPLLGAVVAFCVGLPLLALVAAPLAAGGSLLVGLLAGLLAIAGSAVQRVRHDG
ncbi:hypothetical protein [Pseudomonas sp. BN515]|uniref:hypothetical protein n=1 Tax=Pseudomonas sp. BN515 TaxID=2567892 RepID=UPI002455F576|nr:hypothetical protein [Pseudomonas sp. BN515]MDH4869809.1 hypothetical protein [Pseudomonas sp. BN515]